MDNERDYVEAAFWLDYAADTLPQFKDTLEAIKEALRDKLDTGKAA